MYIGSESAVIGKLLDTHEYQKLFSIGSVEKAINMEKLSAIVNAADFSTDEVFQVDELVLVKLEDYYFFATLHKNEKLKTEKLYLLKLFIQNAAKAIINVQLYESLVQKEKLSAVGKALSMLMHDLRSPIKNIPIFSSFIRKSGYTSKWLDMIDRCGEQASEIFDDFLDFIRETPIKLLPVSINTLIEEGIALADNRSPITNITIEKELGSGLFVLGDNSKLKRIIMNLVSNAVDVLKDYKIIDPRIIIKAQKKNNAVVISIKDNGPGIPDYIKENIFDAFVTANKSNGTGLGLAIVKQYILAHNGTITVSNNNGAMFTIVLPLAN
jgi:signal transduction histidine kinase